MRHDGIGALCLHDDVQNGPSGRRHDIGLHAPQVVRGITARPHVIPDLRNGMQGREVIRPAVHEIKPHPLAGFGLQRFAAGNHRMVLKDPAVEDDVVIFPVEHSLHVIRVVEEFRLHQHVLAVGFGHRLRVLGVHNDHTDHAPCDMLDHRWRPTMVGKHPWLLGHKVVGEAFARIDGSIVLKKVSFGRMKIHGMRVGVGFEIVEGEMNGIAFRHPHDGARELPVIGPGLVFSALPVNHDFCFDGGEFHVDGPGDCRRVAC